MLVNTDESNLWKQRIKSLCGNIMGKTTNASRFPNALLLAFEKGYSALPGVYAKPMNSWGDMIKVLRELKDPAVKEKFETIVIDTARIAI